MTRLAALLCLLLVATTGCDSTTIIVTTSPSALSFSSIREVREITVGEHVNGTLHVHGAEHVFVLTARSDGTLVVRVSWSTPGRIELWLDGGLRSQAARSPIVGRLPVVAGRRYRVRVADAAAWDYGDWSQPYTLTTRIE